MIQCGDTAVGMVFDSDLFKYMSISNDKLKYPNKISKELKEKIELSVAIVIDTLLK